MCLTNKQSVVLDKVEAFKIFAITERGLESPFVQHNDGDPYKENELVTVNDPDNYFYAFENEKNAIYIANQGAKEWRVITNNLIVLPVTLFDVAFKGDFYIRSKDIQCLDSYFKCFMSKKIIVHSSKELKRKFYLTIVDKLLDSHKITPLEKEAIKHLTI